MTADARPPFAADRADIHGPLADRPRLFPSRLRPAQPHARPDMGRIRLLSRLWVQHASLEHRIAQEAARPRPDAEGLRALKREKLAIRDRIASLEHRA